MKKRIALLLLLCLALPLAMACQSPEQTEAGGSLNRIPGAFDYMTSDLSTYLSLPESVFPTISISVTDIPEITESDVLAEFNSYFEGGNYLCPKAGADTVAEGDLLYLAYHGVLISELEKAVAENKIPDIHCTGLSYTEILSFGLGFSGGTVEQVRGITVGSANFIAGFEEGLVGQSVSQSGNANPVRLYLTFPQNYGNAELAGKSVIFFCRLAYIGDPTAAPITKDTITVELLNELLGLTKEQAYPDLDTCLNTIREEMVRSRDNQLYSEKANALYATLIEKATFYALPEEALTAYVRDFLEAQLASLRELYEESPAYYAYLFGNETPNEALLAAYYGYSRDNYMEEMKQDCIPAIKSELCYHYLVRRYQVGLSDEEYAAFRAEYTALYGEGIFEGMAESEIRTQFLREKLTRALLDYLEENGRINYTTTS